MGRGGGSNTWNKEQYKRDKDLPGRRHALDDISTTMMDRAQTQRDCMCATAAGCDTM
jgi:hypothetical protein